MIQYAINGGKPLYGDLSVSGAKNAAIAIIPAAILVDGVCRIENVPAITDVTIMLQILRDMGVKVEMRNSSALTIDASHIRRATPPAELCRSMRASYYILGAMLGRYGEASAPPPGGCDFENRPMDLHIKGFEALGANVRMLEGNVVAGSQERLKGCTIYLDFASVGATVNIMLASVLADGLTVIENAAREPHIVDLANFLNTMGADIKGAGTDLIKIRGKERLSGGTYTIIPDQIEAGTYMACVASAGGDAYIRNVIPKHLECISAKLMEMGAEIDAGDDYLRVTRNIGRLKRTNIKTLPYPGFPTDMQPQIAACLTAAEGTSMVTEGVWGGRYRYVDELSRMGAKITVNSKIAVIEGIDALTGAYVRATDLRAGAALIVAALGARGCTTIDEISHIMRGYDGIVEKLQGLGADISEIKTANSDFLRAAR